LLLPTGLRRFEETPEGLLVAGLAEVAELVDDDILEDLRRGRGETP
jgi:hypothetical protein